MELCLILFLWLFRQPDGEILAKDLAIEYKYLSNTSEWFYNARKKAESVSQMGRPLKIGKQTVLVLVTDVTHYWASACPTC